MKKVIIIGCPGSGKSTFAKALHEKTGLPLFHLDMMYWNADRTIVEKPVFRQRLSEAMTQEVWIIDGNYGSTMELRMQECDTIFFLDYPVEVCLEGVRARRGKKRSDMPWAEGEDEEDAEFLSFIRSYNEESRPVVLELLKKYADKAIYVFESRSAANAFFESVQLRDRNSQGFGRVVLMVNRLKYGNTNTYLIRGTSGNLLVDTDYAGTLPLFYKEIKQQNISLKDITYVLATHYHPDHIGLVSELMKQGVKLLLVDEQREYVGFSDEIFAREKRLAVEPIRIEEAEVITCEESRGFLQELGIDGEIISTNSHSEGSVSLILDDGTCIVGDLEPMEYLGAYEENEKLKEDWEKILSYKPKRICYGHANEMAV